MRRLMPRNQTPRDDSTSNAAPTSNAALTSNDALTSDDVSTPGTAWRPTAPFRALGTGLGVAAVCLALLAPAACTVDPDEDFPPGSWPDATPRPDTSDNDTADDTGDDTDTDPGDTSDDTDPDTGSGGPCDGHCDCTGNEYCAATGTCQLIIISGPYYCCTDSADDCPAGQPCHIPGEVGSGGVCGEELPGDPEGP